MVIWDQAGFHPRLGHPLVPAGVHVLRLPPDSPELNPVEKIGAFIKDAVCHKLWQTMEAIEAAISGEVNRSGRPPQQVAKLLGEKRWLNAQLNASAKIYQSR